MSPVSRGKFAAGRLLVLAVLLLASCGGQAATDEPPTRAVILLPAAATAAPAPTRTPAISPPSAPTAESALVGTPIPAPTATPIAAPSLIALGVRPTVALRAAPAAAAMISAQAPGATVFQVTGRSADGAWLWVATADDRARGWVAASDLKVYGTPAALAALPVVAATVAAAPTPAATPAGARGATPPALIGKVVFQAATGGDIYLVAAAGGPALRLTTGLDPALSPDGQQIAFARWGDAAGIYIRDLATGAERRVAAANRPRSPSWSSDQTHIVFARLAGIHTCRQSPFGCLTDDELRARFGGQECLPTPTGPLCIADFPIVQLERSSLTEIGADGAGWRDLPAPPDAQAPAWRPRSAEALFLGAGVLQVTTPDGAPRALAAAPWTTAAAWSPDGSHIIAQRRVHDQWQIVLLDATGAMVRQLTTGAANNVAPAWSPDGRTILFLSDRDGRWRLYRMDAAGAGQALFRSDALAGVEIRYDFAAERVASWAR